MNIVYQQKLQLKVVQEQAFYYNGRILSSSDAYEAVYCLWDKDEIAVSEQFYALFLNRQNVPKGFAKIAHGGMAFCQIDMKILMTYALNTADQSMIIAHNHPSESNQPSQADIDLTKKIKAACQLLDIQLLDHIIVMPQQNVYYSFGDNGLL